MSLIDVVIEVIQHPATQQLSPLVRAVLLDEQEQRRIEIQRTTLDKWQAINAGSPTLAEHPEYENEWTRFESDLTEAVAAGAGSAAATVPAPAKQDDLYAVGNRYDVGCAVCGKAHLAATAGMMDRAAKLAQDRGTCDADCGYYLSAAQREVVNLVGYDWTPEAIAATPEGERQLLTQWAPQVDQLQDTLFQGPEAQARMNLAKAAGALEEAGRFARAEGVNHPEAQQRMADAEAWLAETERGEWSPERRQQMDAKTRAMVYHALPAFRKQRQFLINGIDSPEDLDRVAAEVGTLNAQLQGIAWAQLTPDQIQGMAAQTQQIRQGFRQALTAYQQQGGTVV